MKTNKTIKFKGNELFIKVSKYRSNGNLAITAYTDEEPYGDITVNLPGMFLWDNSGFINSNTKDSGLEKKLFSLGIIEELINRVQYNYGKYDQVSFNMEKLKEYDSKGVEEYLASIEDEEEFE